MLLKILLFGRYLRLTIDNKVYEKFNNTKGQKITTFKLLNLIKYMRSLCWKQKVTGFLTPTFLFSKFNQYQNVRKAPKSCQKFKGYTQITVFLLRFILFNFEDWSVIMKQSTSRYTFLASRKCHYNEWAQYFRNLTKAVK